jgi:hypothetical protein
MKTIEEAAIVMIELSKEEKLKLLPEILKNYYRGFLCSTIGDWAYTLEYITAQQYLNVCASRTAQTLIPELLQFKPENLSPNAVWFPTPLFHDPDPTRKKVLEDLIKLIENEND